MTINKQTKKFALKFLQVNENSSLQTIQEAYLKAETKNGKSKLLDDVYDYLKNKENNQNEGKLSYDKAKFNRAFALYEVLKECNDEFTKMQSKKTFVDENYDALYPEQLNDDVKFYVDSKKKKSDGMDELSNLDEIICLCQKKIKY